MRHLPLFLTLALLGCGAGAPVRGTLLGPEIPAAPVPRAPQITLAVPTVVDERPDDEHEGSSVRTRLFIFFGVGVHIRREGNFLTNDFTVGPDAVKELRGLAIQHLTAGQVAKKVVATGAADFELRLAAEHVYGTHFAANKQTVVVLSSKQSTDAFVDVQSHNYAAYGNVTLRAQLVDKRAAGPGNVVWTEHVTGYAQRPAGEQRILEVQNAVQLATADALATLTQRVGATLDRLGVGPSGAPMVLASGSALPASFAIERMSRYRDFLERVFVDTSTGRVLRHEVMPAPDRYSSRPGDWVLSRVTAEGLHLSGDGYEAFARALAARYDLRRVDDVTHYHFFGVRGAT
ncbi:MAG: hypothetical protein JNL79_07660 [Myxococcales bacterium]|nr:hypothetical protein [Myxococcales bacterium]